HSRPDPGAAACRCRDGGRRNDRRHRQRSSLGCPARVREEASRSAHHGGPATLEFAGNGQHLLRKGNPGMSAPPLRIGIAGVGRMGRHHASNLAQRVVGAELVAACSPVADELAWARDTLGVAHGYNDYAQLLAHPGLDAVFLATPTTLHADQIAGALQAGKHVFSEKPLALNLDDCLRVEAVAAKHPRQIAMIGYVRRFDPSYRDAFDKIKAGAIGRPFLARSQTTDK